MARNWTVALLLSVFLGSLGIDRFYMGYIGLGILKLLTVGGCGIWAIIDIILIATNKLKDADGKELEK
jgi:TM2 domain-containing membrane protein YozV